MTDYNFNTNPGETVARELLVAYLNTGTAEAPVWSPLGKRVEDSSAEYGWGESNSQDILGNTWARLKKPVITQTFEPCDLDAGDEAQKKIWQLAVVEQNAQAALSVADRGYVLETGKIVTSGTGAELLNNEQLCCFFAVLGVSPRKDTCPCTIVTKEM